MLFEKSNPMQRSDTKGLFQTVGALILVSGSAVFSYYLFLQQSWIAFGITFFLHGTMASIYVSGGHELDHGTVFKTGWLNRFFLKIYALLSWFNFHDYALSHTYHHRYTLHPTGHREVVLTQSTNSAFLVVNTIVYNQHHGWTYGCRSDNYYPRNCAKCS